MDCLATFKLSFCIFMATSGRFLKIFNAGFYLIQKCQKKNFGISNASFLATNIEQHVANLSIFVADFAILDTHFGIFKAKFLL